MQLKVASEVSVAALVSIAIRKAKVGPEPSTDNGAKQGREDLQTTRSVKCWVSGDFDLSTSGQDCP